MPNDEAKIIKLLSDAAQAEIDRREIEAERLEIEIERRKEEAERLSLTYEILAISQDRREIEKRLSQVATLHLDILRDMAEEVIGLTRETKELIAVLLHLFMADDRDKDKIKNLETLIYEPDSKVEEIQKFIMLHQSVLRRLKEQAVKWGSMHTPIHIQLQIEDTEREIEELQRKLRES